MKVTELAHREAARVLKEGCRAVDATSGNGKDTLFLARQVGSRGQVYAFDIQAEALRRTAAALEQARLQDRVKLIRAGHEQIAAYIGAPVDAVMFNLGYLPGGDRHIVTRVETTLAGLAEALVLLRPGGLVTIVVYPGHREGEKEKEALLRYCGGLDGNGYALFHASPSNQANRPPELITIRKAGRLTAASRPEGIMKEESGASCRKGQY